MEIVVDVKLVQELTWKEETKEQNYHQNPVTCVFIHLLL